MDEWQATIDSDFTERITELIDTALETALGLVPATVDSREGSIIYDAIAPLANLVEGYLDEMLLLVEQTYAGTATAEWLDARAAEQGIERYAATAAQVVGVFVRDGSPAVVPLGDMFAAQEQVTFPDGTVGAPVYQATAILVVDESPVPGSYVLTSTVGGTHANIASATLIPATNMATFESADIESIDTAGTDVETDAELRIRYFRRVTGAVSGGNRAQYNEWLDELDIDYSQIWVNPTAAGEVGIALPEDQTAQDALKEALDPTGFDGEGLGLVPIGHSVLVDEPDDIAILISGDVDLLPGYTEEQVSPLLDVALAALLVDLQDTWKTYTTGVGYSCVVYRSAVYQALMLVEGVQSVTSLEINTLDADLVIDVSAWPVEWPDSIGDDFVYV